MERAPQTDPDALFTPNGLAARVRALNGGRAPSPKLIRSAARAGLLRAASGGSWTWIRWGDWLNYLESQRVAPQAPDNAREWAEHRIERERLAAAEPR